MTKTQNEEKNGLLPEVFPQSIMGVEEKYFGKDFDHTNTYCKSPSSGNKIGNHNGVDGTDNAPRYGFCHRAGVTFGIARQGNALEK